MGVIRVLNTPAGDILRTLVESGVQVGISSRGLGSVKEKSAGLVTVQDDFQLICYDVVADPSTSGAFMGQLKEHKGNERIFDKDYRINVILNNILG